MSIGTSFYAGYANNEKDRWVDRMKSGVETRSWDVIEELLKDMDKFTFSE